jgi:hypothetical protein
LSFFYKFNNLSKLYSYNDNMSLDSNKIQYNTPKIVQNKGSLQLFKVGPIII